MQILPTFSQHLKLFRVDLKLSNEHHRSFVAQKLAPVAQIEFRWKFWKIDFWMKNLISDRKSNFSIRSWIEPQKRVFVVERRATRRWNRLGPYFWVMSTLKYVHTSGTSHAHIRHIPCTHQAHYAKKIPFFDDFCHVSLMCLMCADTSDVLATFKTV